MIQAKDVKQIQLFLGDDTFGDYARIIVSNPNNKYNIEDLKFKRLELKAGYWEYPLLSMFKGYTIVSRSERYGLPNELEIILNNRFFMLGRLTLGSTDFVGKTMLDFLDWLRSTLNLSSGELELRMPPSYFSKKIPPYQDTSISYLEFVQKVSQAYNVHIWWDYEGKLIVGKRWIPNLPSIEIPKSKCQIKEVVKPFRRATKIQVFGRRLEYWEQNAPEISLGYWSKNAIAHTRFLPYISYMTSQVFTLYYKTKPSWATNVYLTPNQATCNRNTAALYNYRLILVETDYCLLEVKVINVPLYECCLRDPDDAVYRQIFFDIDLRGYRISSDERFSRIYTEWRDPVLESEYAGQVVNRIDNELIMDKGKAEEILEYEVNLNQYIHREVEVEMPLNPLIERFDRIRIHPEFDMYVTSIEHNYEPATGRSKTILRGYKL